jgi:hypothetical protein
MQFLEAREADLNGLPHRFADVAALRKFFALESTSHDSGGPVSA